MAGFIKVGVVFKRGEGHLQMCMTLSGLQPLQDWTLILGVLVLVSVDIVILLVYMLVEGENGSLSAGKFPNRENPNDLIGVCCSTNKLSRCQRINLFVT